jgi:L-aspartate oxidase
MRAPAAQEMRLRALMTAHVGVVRSGDGLAQALGEIVRIEGESGTGPLGNMAVAALLIAAAAWQRRESRGAHYRSDHSAPAARPRHSFLTLAQVRGIAAHSAIRPRASAAA